MLADAQAALTGLLQREGGLDPRMVAIRFEAPSRRLLDTITQPTLLFSLYELTERCELRRPVPNVNIGDKSAVRRMPPRRLELFYLVTAIATQGEDAQALLSRALTTLLKFDELPREVLPPAVAVLDVPVSGRLVGPPDGRAVEIWQGLSASDPRPAFLYALTVPVDLDHSVTVPLVLTRTIAVSPYSETDGKEERPSRSVGAEEQLVGIGGVVLDSHGSPAAGVAVQVAGRGDAVTRTDAGGRFRLFGLATGPVWLELIDAGGSKRRFQVTVPSPDYHIILDRSGG